MQAVVSAQEINGEAVLVTAHNHLVPLP